MTCKGKVKNQIIYCSRYIEFNQYSTYFVKLREREGQGVDPGRSPKGHLWMVDGGILFPDALH